MQERRRLGKIAAVLSVSMAFMLVLMAVPAMAANPTVTTVAASGVGDFQAQLNGNLATLGSGNTKVKVGFQYGTSATLVSPTNVTVGSKTTTGTFEKIVYLSSGVKYYFRAWARNFTGDVDRSQYAQGAILSFTMTNTVGNAGATLSALLPTIVNLTVIVLVFGLIIGVVGSLGKKFTGGLGGGKGD